MELTITPLILSIKISFTSIASFPRERDKGENPRKPTSLLHVGVMTPFQNLTQGQQRKDTFLLSHVSPSSDLWQAETRARSPSSHTGRVTSGVQEETNPVTIPEASVHKWGHLPLR